MSPPPNRSALTRRGLLGRAAAAGLLATPAASLLAACATGGDGGGPAPGDVTDDNPFGFDPTSQIDTVFFTGGFGTEYPEAFRRLFEQRYPESQVGVLGTETIGTVVRPRFAGGNPPDLLNNSGDDLLDLSGLVNDEAVLDLAPLLDAPSLDDPAVRVRDVLQPGTIEAGTFGQSMYALNYSYSTYGMWYDARLFREHGWTPPTTWSQFLALAEEMRQAGIAPFIHQGQFPFYIHNVFMEWVYAEGGLEAVIRIDNLEPGAWRQEAVMTAAQRLHEMVQDGLIYPGSAGLSHTESQQLWLDHEAGFIWCGSWLENEMAETTPAGFEMTLTAPWAPSDSPATPAGSLRVGAGEQFVVPSQAANTAGGLEFLRMMCSRAAGQTWAELTRSTSVVIGSAEGVESTALVSAAQVAASAPEIMDWKGLGWYGTIYEEMEAEIAELMAGRSTPQALIDRVQAEADRVAADDSIEKFTRQG
jgi:N-acetylglucosamine transport system substrate-binding protein